MTASRQRRTHSTWIALSLLIGALIAAGVLGMAGVRTLYDSRAGREADDAIDALATQRLPFTPTALVGTLDDTGRLTSLVVMALEPDGTGGSIVQMAASADANSGNEEVVMPLNLVLTTQGPEAFSAQAEALAGVAFDVVELVDQQRFTQLITPLGDVPVTMPTALYDASSGDRWAAEPLVLAGADVARVVTATDPSIADYLFEPARAAIWRGVADRVGAGIGSAEPVASDADLPRPPDLDQFVARLFAGPVQFRALGVRPLADDRVAEQLPVDMVGAFGATAVAAVSVHDRAEMLMVMGAVAPGRVGAPLDAPSFRVASGFTPADLEPLGLRNSDVLNQAIDRLLFAQVNVVSVAQLPGSPVPEHSTFVVSDPSAVDGVRESYQGTFGADIEVRAAEVLIDGVDVELILGRDFLANVADPAAADVESSAEDASTETSEPSESGNETGDG